MVLGYLWGMLFRTRTKRYIDKSPKLKMTLDLMEGNAYKVLLLFRLGPIPYSILNLICGVSTIPFYTYVLASLPGLMIEQTLVTYMGSSLGSLSDVSSGSADSGSGQAINYTIIVLQIVCSVALLVFIAVYVKRVLKAAELAKLQQKQQASADSAAKPHHDDQQPPV